MTNNYKRTTVILASLLFVSSVFLAGTGITSRAATAPGLGTAADYAVFGAATVTNTGPSLIIGGSWSVSRSCVYRISVSVHGFRRHRVRNNKCKQWRSNDGSG